MSDVMIILDTSRRVWVPRVQMWKVVNSFTSEISDNLKNIEVHLDIVVELKYQHSLFGQSQGRY